MQVLQLPFDGELIASERKSFNELVVFVHQFGGSKKTLSRHVHLVNELGFDAVVFNLVYHDTTALSAHLMRNLPITGDLHFGARHIWEEQIEAVLNAVPGRKILFSFSMPTNSAFTAIANRRSDDVAGIICDGGPFLQLNRCIWNLYTHQFKLESRLVRGVFTAASLAIYGTGLERELAGRLQALPRGFPILSIRYQNDSLVPSEAIDEFFTHGDSMRIDRVMIEGADHLEGLKVDAMKYGEAVRGFLKRVAR